MSVIGSSTNRNKLPYFLLVVAVLTLFWPALLHPFHILHPTFSPFSDTMVIHWPKAHLMAQSWQASDGLPHWTPLILSGMPLAANQLAMLSYPPAWLFLILPLEPTFNILFIFHLLLGGLGINLLLREGCKLSLTASLLGSLAFALNGKWLAHIAGGHVSMVGAIGWMPWVMFGLMMLLKENRGASLRLQEQGSKGGGSHKRELKGQELEIGSDSPPPSQPLPSRGRGDSSRLWGVSPAPRLPCSPALLLSRLRWAILVAVALAMQIVTHTLIFIYGVYLIGAMVVWHFIGGGWRGVGTEIKSYFLPLLLIPILAGLLGAGQLLPLLELVEFSNRSLSLAQAAEYAVTPTQLLIGLFLPSAQGGHEYVIYLGLIPLLLVPFGLTRRNRWTWFYGGLLVFSILFALGPSTPVHSLFYHFVPGFRWVRTPARILFVGALAAAVLVGFGVEQLTTIDWSPRAQKILTRIVMVVGTVALILGLGLAIGFGQIGRAPFALAIFVPAGLGLILLRVRHVISARLANILLGAVLFLDLASFDMSMMRFVPLDEAIAPGRPAAEYLAQKPGYFRVYSPSYSLPLQTAAAYDLHLADGVEPVHLSIYDQYMARAGGYNNSGFSVTIPNFGHGLPETALKDTEPNLKLLGLLNVKYLASAFPLDWPGLRLETEVEGTYIYVNQQALPRAWVVHQTLPAEADWLTQLETLPDVANIATVEGNFQLTGTTTRAGTAFITHYSPDLIEIETKIKGPGWLVLSEIRYPGWQATTNGSPQPVEKVNGMLRGLYLSQAGQYQITMQYRPRSVVWGNWIAVVTAGLTILAGIWALKKTISSNFSAPL